MNTSRMFVSLATIVSLYGCANTATDSYKSVGCTSDSECKNGRVCNVQKGVCEDKSIDTFVGQKDVYDAGVQRQYDSGSFIDNVEPDVTVEEEVSYVQDVVSLPETYVDVAKEVYVDLSSETYVDIGSKDQGYDIFLKVVKGDVNCDDDVTFADMKQMNDYLAGKITQFSASIGGVCLTGKEAADVNCDQNIDSIDVALMKKYIVTDGNYISIQPNGCWKTKYMKGDVNCDGVVDNLDANAVFDYYGFDKPFPTSCPNAKDAADVNCDGLIDNDDISAISDNYFGDVPFLDKNGKPCL